MGEHTAEARGVEGSSPSSPKLTMDILGFLNKKRIEIVDQGNEIQLRYNGYTYSAFNKSNLFIGAYWDYFSPIPIMFDHPSILIIGLGAGTIATQIKTLFNNATIDGIETSKEIAEIARKLRKVEYNIIEADGYDYVQKVEKLYDVVILDAYVDDTIPEKFLSEDFVKMVKEKTTLKGIFAINYALTSKLIQRKEEFLSLLKKYWNKIYLLDHPGRSYNEIILASKSINIKQYFSQIDKERIIQIHKDLLNIVEAYINAREYEEDK